MTRAFLALLLVVLLSAATLSATLAANQNAATFYQEAMKKAAVDDLDDNTVTHLLAQGWAKSQGDLGKMLDDNKAALDEMRQGSQVAKCRFLPDRGIIGKTELPDYTKLTILTHLLQADAQRQIAAGNTDGALEDLLDALRVSLHVQQDGTAVGRNTGLDLQQAAFLQILEFLESDKATAAQLTRAATEAQKIASLETPLSHTVDTERAWTEATVDDLAKVKPGTNGDILDELSVAQRAQVAQQYHKLADGLFAELHNAASTLNVDTMYRTEVSMVKQAPRSPQSPSDYAKAIAARLVPSFVALVPRYGTGEVELAGLPALFAIKAYKTAHQKYPATLAALTLKQLPRDPYGSGPMHYRLAGTKAVLYSVGPDGKDDGGKKPLLNYAKPQGTDILLELR